jgi:hypothetical protein
LRSACSGILDYCPHIHGTPPYARWQVALHKETIIPC